MVINSIYPGWAAVVCAKHVHFLLPFELVIAAYLAESGAFDWGINLEVLKAQFVLISLHQGTLGKTANKLFTLDFVLSGPTVVHRSISLKSLWTSELRCLHASDLVCPGFVLGCVCHLGSIESHHVLRHHHLVTLGLLDALALLFIEFFLHFKVLIEGLLRRLDLHFWFERNQYA